MNFGKTPDSLHFPLSIVHYQFSIVNLFQNLELFEPLNSRNLFLNIV